MAHPLSREDILFRQRLLSCSGLYRHKLDGVWGRHTNEADREFFLECDRLESADGTLDPRSERSIRSLQLPAQALCRRSIAAIRATGLDARVISGTRSYGEQAALYRQGRFGSALPRVTNAKAGQSWHNFGLAWDIGVFRAGDYLTDGPEYGRAAQAGKIDGVEWGGDWVSFKDKPHYQVAAAGRSVSAARAVFEAGGRSA